MISVKKVDNDISNQMRKIQFDKKSAKTRENRFRAKMA